ncbi:MAG: TRAP transporter large permease [Oscillospiraceae bacterium]|nr:TRAP transporter large permease [Oscillospiraceae bacterium]
MITAALFGGFLVCLFFSTPIALCLAGGGLLATFLSGNVQLFVCAQKLFASIDSFTLMAIPFFMIAGNLMSSGGISKRLCDFANALIGWIPGGLACASILACMIFGALSGSPTATVAAIGGILVPALIENGYSRKFSLATIAVAGLLGTIIPPSTIMITYSSCTDASIGSMFMGGILPGIALGICMMVIAVIYGVQHQDEITSIPFSLARVGKTFVRGIGAFLMPVIILGGIYTGIFTPTESAAIACIYGLIVGIFFYRELRVSDLKQVLTGSATASAMVMIIIACAGIFGMVMTREQIPAKVATFLIAVSGNKYIFLLLVNIMLLIVGCFLETTAAILIIAPVLLPAATAFGINPIHFGIIMCVNLAIGCATPPLGVNLYVAAGLTHDKVDMVVNKHLLWYILASIVALLIITYCEPLVMLLPNMMAS